MEQLQKPHRIMNFKARGIIRYNPDRGSLKTGNHNWAVLEALEDGLSDYYRFQFFKKYGISLEKPSWSPHISMIKGWDINSDKEWGWRDGEEVDFEYSHALFWNKNFVWVNTQSQAMYDIQEYYGFGKKERGHLTIGRIPSKNINDIPMFSNYDDLSLWDNKIITPF